MDNDIAGVPRTAVEAALQETADQIKKLVPSDANGSAYQYGGALVRTFLAFEAGRGAGWALDVSGSEASLIGFIIAGLAIAGWSLLQKKWSAWRTHETAKASGAASAAATTIAGTPTVVALEPPPNKI